MKRKGVSDEFFFSFVQHVSIKITYVVQNDHQNDHAVPVRLHNLEFSSLSWCQNITDH